MNTKINANVNGNNQKCYFFGSIGFHCKDENSNNIPSGIRQADTNRRQVQVDTGFEREQECFFFGSIGHYCRDKRVSSSTDCAKFSSFWNRAIEEQKK